MTRSDGLELYARELERQVRGLRARVTVWRALCVFAGIGLVAVVTVAVVAP